MCDLTRRTSCPAAPQLWRRWPKARQACKRGSARSISSPKMFISIKRPGGKGYCNNGWIILEDYVLVIDANFPSGANEIIPRFAL